MKPTLTTNHTGFSIHPATGMGAVSLKVTNLDKQIVFYEQTLGFVTHWREGNEASMGTGKRELIRLAEYPGLKRYNRTTGLYHFAILFPNQCELAVAMARLFSQRYPNSPTDHIMTKTTYLSDPEGNGIELYAESPDDGWMGTLDGEFIARRADGTLSNGREALDLDALFSRLDKDTKLDGTIPLGTRMGHVHLHVRNLREAVDFYHGLIGFDVMGVDESVQMGFVSAGGYHHHVGLNTWQGAGAPPPPADAAGLAYMTVEVPDQATLDVIEGRVEEANLTVEHLQDGFKVFDPSHNAVVLKVKKDE